MKRVDVTLVGHAVVISAADTDAGEAQAHALAPTGAALVLCGRDGARLGALSSQLVASGAQVAIFLDDPAVESRALCEMVTELFGPRNP